ncbi:DapH/DapD/GlmU-related protein, partial [Pyramidobacter sp.]
GYVVAEDIVAEENVKMGPFCFLRDGTHLLRDSFAGKFVEIKNSEIGEGTKVPHLSYMGDAVIGAETNIGAASVTCNYDGVNKNKTRIGARCFIGSDTMFVAPVNIGDGAVVGAGSVITRDVPAGALAVARNRQVVREGWAQRKKAEHEKNMEA